MGVSDSPLRDRVLFVEGVPRSGTTPLASMLTTHPEIAGVLAESHLFSIGVAALFDGNRNHTSQFLNSYLPRARLVDRVRDLSDEALIAMRERVKPEAPWVMDKTPAPRQRAAELLASKRECYPDAWYAHIVRDREGTVRSLVRAPWGRVDRSVAERWSRQGVDAIRSAFGDSERYLEIEYERLTADPRGTATALLDWLGLAHDEDVLEPMLAISKERISTAPATARATDMEPLGVTHRVRSSLRRARGAVRTGVGARRASRERRAQELFGAMRAGDPDLIRRLTATDLVVELRSGAGDRRAQGDAARDVLGAIGSAWFGGGLIGEQWVPARSHVTFLSWAIEGDGTRKDACFALLIRDGLIAHVGIIAAGDLGGRKPRRWAAED